MESIRGSPLPGLTPLSLDPVFADPVPLIISESNNGNPLRMSTMGIQVEIMHWLRIFMQAYSAISDGRFPALLKGDRNSARDNVRGITHDLYYGKITSASAFLLLR